ncbi:MAG: NADH-quinone oxidoreductase subunit C [Dehalococcoidia bacterium]
MATSDSPHGHGADAEWPDVTSLSQSRQDLLALVAERLSEFNPQSGVLSDLPQIMVEPQNIVGVCRRLKEEPGLDFQMLLCLSCVDYEDHFQTVYFLQSLQHEQTLVVKADVPYDSPRLPSVTEVWPAAEWYEREAHDLFGVSFDGHPDLTPLLLYEGFEGYPGRKEFPFYEYQEF